MRITYEPITVKLSMPFVIAHGASTERHNVLVRLADGEQEGWGEAAPVRQHHETQASVLEYLATATRAWPADADPFRLEELLAALPPGSQAGRAALDIALHDLVAKKLGVPLYRLFGLSPAAAPPTSFTISIGPLDEVRRNCAAAPFPILKLKLGPDVDHCIASVRAAREATQARIAVDANCAWTEEQALRAVPALADLGVEFVEQPVAEEDVEGLRRVRAASAVPIFADEPVRRSPDVARLAGCVDGVNIKLMKSGGLREALRMVAAARAHGLKVMLGCMIETSLGITAAAQIASLFDYADIDGNVTVTNDPYLGVTLDYGRLILPEGPGLGVTRRSEG